jgi:hypothetical protein
MASLIAKLKKNKRYYYVVESARVNGQPRIVHQTYLGSAEKVAALVKDRTAPVPVSASFLELGLPGALWLAAQDTGVFRVLHSFWPEPRSGPSPAHYLLLAAIHRICRPGPKTEVADWYRKTVLFPSWGFPGFLGLLRTDLARTAESIPERGQGSAGGSPTALAGVMEGPATGEPTGAGLRYHQLLHFHRQHERA